MRTTCAIVAVLCAQALLSVSGATLGAGTCSAGVDGADFYSRIATTPGAPDVASLRSKVVLVVNVASRCGYTVSHYKELNKLVQAFPAKDFAVVAFPCNQFGHQEPDPVEHILGTLHQLHSITPAFALADSKIDVNGGGAAPVYEFLRASCPARAGSMGVVSKAVDVAWNFEKFLVGRSGKPLGRFDSNISPLQLVGSIEDAMASQHEL